MINIIDEIDQVLCYSINKGPMSLAGRLADLISDYLGPTHPRPNPQTSSTTENLNASSKTVATLVVLRNRIDTDSSASQLARDVLIWQLREAIRTEFFQIQYPIPPSKALLNLVTSSELILTEYRGSQRPIYFPGARVAVPTEVGTHRAATTLQLRFKSQNNKTVTEVLLHLDGPNGGSFQWVPSTILMLLSSCVPIPNPDSRGQSAKNLTSRPTTATTGTRGRRPLTSSTTASGTLNANVRTNRSSRSRKTEYRSSVARSQMTTLPASYIPYALRSTSPPPRKRLRQGIHSPLSLSSGSIRRALGSFKSSSVDERELSADRSLSSDLANTLGIERLVSRRRNSSLGNRIQYFVKWLGSPLAAGSWEFRDALIRDVPGLVVAFDITHPGEPPTCRAVGDNSLTPQCSLDGERAEEADNIPNIFPILSIRFSGMQLHIEEGGRYSFYTNEDEFKLERKKRIALLKNINPEAFNKTFSSNTSDFLVESNMKLQPNDSIMSVPSLKGNLLSVLQKSVDSHHKHNRVPIPFPRGLGRVLSSNTSSVIPLTDIRTAPASWERYLLSMGLNCRNWNRELLPDMPTASERIASFVERKSNELNSNAVSMSYERNKISRRKTREYVGRPCISTKRVEALKSEPVSSNTADNLSIVRTALELASRDSATSSKTIWADFT